jgi:hypothetical protein
MIHRFPLLAATLLASWSLSGLAGSAGDDKQAPPGQEADSNARLAAKLDKHRKKYGDNMLYEVDEKLKIIFVIGSDKRMLAEVKQRLSAHAEALRRDLFKHGPKDYLSVIVPRKWANPKVTGHFYPDWVDAATIGSNLMHEFTHALHYADQVGRDEYQPVWVMEGFASMYEKSAVVDGHAVPLVNRRLVELQQEVANKKFLPFEKMMKLEHRRFTSHHYAQARYMCMWLYSTGRLNQWYATYTGGFKEDPSGIAAMEMVFGKKIAELEKEWIDWLLKQEPPKLVLGPGSAGLGIGANQLPDGLEISQLAPQGAADKAGLAIGDALIRVGGERVIEMEDLVMVLAKNKVGESVKIEYRRDGNYAETSALLTPLAAAAQTPPDSQ